MFAKDYRLMRDGEQVLHGSVEKIAQFLNVSGCTVRKYKNRGKPLFGYDIVADERTEKQKIETTYFDHQIQQLDKYRNTIFNGSEKELNENIRKLNEHGFNVSARKSIFQEKKGKITWIITA